jgi:hypothetical protein
VDGVDQEQHLEKFSLAELAQAILCPACGCNTLHAYDLTDDVFMFICPLDHCPNYQKFFRKTSEEMLSDNENRHLLQNYRAWRHRLGVESQEFTQIFEEKHSGFVAAKEKK